MSTITQFPSGNTQYRIEFDYLARTFVVVTLVNSSNPTLNRVLEVGRDYRFLNPTMIEMLVDQSGFDIVRIHRQTGTDLVVDFRNGSVLTASDLTNAELQAIHIAEEGRDQTVDLAKEYADAAGSSAGNAKDSEDEARRIAESIKAAGRFGYITRRSFEKGFNVTTWNEALLWEEDGDYYRWDGTLPKNVPAGSTPEASGGIGLGAWVSVGDASLRADLSSKDGMELIGGDLKSYGADASGSTPCDSQLSQMLADKKFIVNSGTYLITSTIEVDISSLEYVEVGPDVEFIIKSNINGFIFKNPNANFDANGMRITVDIPGGGYTSTALTLRGGKYYTGPANFSRLSHKNKFGPFYVYNRQGAVKQESASAPVTDEGYGFSIDCNSAGEEILIWNEVDVSSTGFTVAHAIGVGTNPLNFISSLDLKLVSWFSTYHFRDTSIPKSGGNVAGGIGDVRVRLQSQPHAQMVKVVHMEHAPGFMSGCRFDLSIWDPNAYGYTANVVDASVTNEYTNTMERKAYPLTRVLNMVDGSIFPVVNYTSSIQQSDILSSSDPELAKYLYLSTVTPEMTVLQACNAIKTWCNENNIRNNFEFKVFLGDSTADIRNVFLPWITAIGDSSGYLHLYATFYNGIINTVRVEYEVNPITSGGKTEKHEILWTNTTGLVLHRLIEYSFGTTAEIKSKVAIQVKGFTTFDSTFNIPVWYNGNSSWLKADGSVAYSA
uniref:Tail protein n=1 Tax=Escherichia phage Baskent_phicoli_1 TaxID=3145031 RepID=A0AAU8B8R4_9CAUD